MRGQHREVALQSRCPKTLAAPQSTGAAELGKHPVEIGHDEIEVRFAPMSRRLGVGPDVRPGVYFPAYFGNSVQAVWPHFRGFDLNNIDYQWLAGHLAF